MVIRSRPWREFESIAERLLDRRAGLRQNAKPKRIACFINGHVYTGHQTQHRTPAARLWRCRLRIKRLIHAREA